MIEQRELLLPDPSVQHTRPPALQATCPRAVDAFRWPASVAVEKSAFISAFDQASTFCRDFAQQLLIVIEELPPTLRFDFATARRTPNQKGLLKFLGGRLVTPAQLREVEPVRARNYLWINGKIPRWTGDDRRAHA